MAYTCTHDATMIAETLSHLLPDIPIAGMSSCRGVVVNSEWTSFRKEFGLGLWALADEASFTQAVHMEDKEAPGFAATFKNQLVATRDSQELPPSFIMLMGSPGNEEAVRMSPRHFAFQTTPAITPAVTDVLRPAACAMACDGWGRLAFLAFNSWPPCSPLMACHVHLPCGWLYRTCPPMPHRHWRRLRMCSGRTFQSWGALVLTTTLPGSGAR